MTIGPGAVRETRRLYGVQLDRDSLGELVDVVLVAGSQVHLSTAHAGTEFSASSVSGLQRRLRRVAGSAHRRVDNLVVESGAVSQRARVDLGPDGCHISVAADERDRVWALGKTEEIRRVLVGAGGSSRRRRLTQLPCAIVGVLAAGVAAVMALRFGLVATTMTVGTLLVLTCTVAGMVAGLVLGKLHQRSDHSALHLGGVPRWTGWRDMTASDRLLITVAALTLLATIIGIAVAHRDAG